MQITCHRKILLLTVLLSLQLLLCMRAHATSVMEVSLDEMLQNSELVFEGEVVDLKVHELGNGAIQTRVTFEVIDVIKGRAPQKMITLGFLGGTYGDRQTTVSEMRMPVLHERGIYFVESPGRNQVHPLYGWSQGHFRVLRDEQDIDRVLAADGEPIAGIEQAAEIRSGKLSKGTARGLKLGHTGRLVDAVDKQEFKRQLRERLR